jgi:hypothetical protein
VCLTYSLFIDLFGGDKMQQQLSDKDEVLTEISKTVTRLRNKGCNVEGLFYGINDKIRNPKSHDDRTEKGKDNIDETIPEGHFIWKPEESFIKVYPEELNKISFKLTGAETLTVIKLLPYIDYQSGMLKIDKRPMILKDIIKITGFSKVTVIGIMAKLVDERILSRNHVGRTYEFFVNPYIFFKGKYINHTLVDMFKEYKKSK